MRPPGCLGRTIATPGPAAVALASSELVRINVLDADHEAHVRAALCAGGGELQGFVFHHFPTNDAWCRDHGAIFVTREGDTPLAALDCGFNAWGGKYPPWDLDDRIARQMAEALEVPRFEGGLVLEGGSIEVNGAGTVLTTENCLLNPNRNPALERADIEATLRALLGVQQVLWLGDGIVGDDTDGHVDDITRFVSRDTVVTAVETDRGDENYRPLLENLERLRSMCLPDGTPLRIIELPMPRPVYHQGERLPASYANFYIANSLILMPAFMQPADETAASVLAACFPGRRIVPVDCRELVVGLGAFHCLTQQVPAVS
jgi:agmatine deiminase